MARVEDLHFETREESDAWVAKRRAELVAFGEKMREEVARKIRQNVKSDNEKS